MTDISPLKGVGQILCGRGRRLQLLLVSENYSVWATLQRRPVLQAHTLKTFAIWQHDARSFSF